MSEHLNDEQQKHRKLVIMSFIISVIVVITFAVIVMPARGVGYSPEQPIPFSHRLHAGKRKIQCIYCHSNVARSPAANVPSMAVCMNCHRVVRVDSPYIQKLTKMYYANKPIQWVHVHVLPDFVFFNHQRHIQRGISCDVCHGDVAHMDRIRQVAPLTMGWCVNCHRRPENHAPTDCYTCHR